MPLFRDRISSEFDCVIRNAHVSLYPAMDTWYFCGRDVYQPVDTAVYNQVGMVVYRLLNPSGGQHNGHEPHDAHYDQHLNDTR
jgi:hypothetical protein